MQSHTDITHMTRHLRHRSCHPPEWQDGGWYMLHGVVTARPAIWYFIQLRAWLDAHPSELVVVWLTRHGDANVGTAQYPATSVEEKRMMWDSLVDLFDGLLFDTDKQGLFDTPLTQLIDSGQRLVIYAADHAEFTGGSSLAIDVGDGSDSSTLNIDNVLIGGDFNPEGSPVDYNGEASSLRGSWNRHAIIVGPAAILTVALRATCGREGRTSVFILRDDEKLAMDRQSDEAE